MFLGLTCPVFFSWAADTTKGLGCWYYQVIVPALLDNFYIEWRQTYIFHLSGLCTAALFPQKEKKTGKELLSHLPGEDVACSKNTNENS